MDRRLEGLGEQSKNYQLYQHNSMISGSEEQRPTSHRLSQVPSSTANGLPRPPVLNGPSAAKPALNYSFQTGEEFALEFMQERAHSRKPPVPNAAGDQKNVTGYMDMKEILGLTHAGSDNGLDASMLARGEKGAVKEFEKKSSHHHEEKVKDESVHSVLRYPSGDGSSRGAIHGYISSGASDSSSSKLKILCSFGGKILPRPSDGKLRYVGGDTRIIKISNGISWEELMQKALKIYSQVHSIKYQLPGEDLDALISVSCDEDLQNMVDECSVLESSKGSQKLRIFLFSASELDDAHSSLGSTDSNSEVQYFVAVNGMDSGQGNGSASIPPNDVDCVSIPNTVNDWEDIRHQSVGTNAALSTGILSPVSSVAMQINSSNYYEPHVQFYGNQMVHYAEGGQFLGVHPPGSSIDLHNQASFTPYMPFQYGHAPHYQPFGVDRVPLRLHGLMSPQHGLLAEELHNESRLHDSEVSMTETMLKVGDPFQQINEIEPKRFLEGDAVSSMHHHDSSPADSSMAHAPEKGTSLLPNQPNADGQMSTSPVALNTSQTLDPKDGEQCMTSEGDPADFSCNEPPLLSHSGFRSERIPREQVESLNRLSKSDDNIGSQYRKTHSRSNLLPEETIAETIDPLHEGNLVSHSEQSDMPEKLLHANPPTIEDGLIEFEKYKELANAINMNQNNPIFTPEVVDPVGFVHHGPEKGSDGGEMRPTKAQLKEPVADLSKVVEPAIPPAGVGTGIKLQEDPSSNLPDQGDILIDINDRFPPDLLSDLFNKARIPDDYAAMNPLSKGEAGLSLDMLNHEPRNWSFFRNLAPEEFAKKDVSLIDQDHIVFPAPQRKLEEGAPGIYKFSPLKNEGITLDRVESQVTLPEEILQEPSSIIRADTSSSHQDLIYSEAAHPRLLKKESEDLQMEDSFSKIGGNHRTPDSDYEEGRLEAGHNDGHIANISLVDIGITDLQIIKNEDLEELRELGSGTFGTVYHGKWRGTDVAIKRIKRSCFTGRSSEQERLTVDFWREAEILSRLHHPNVVAFYGVVQDGPGGTLATVAEYMVNGSLRHVLLRKDKYLDRRKRLIIAMDAAFGMEYLHSKNIVHFDLKCDNLLVNLKDPMRPICKVGDFGLSKIKRNTLVSGGVRGTLPWMAPELLNGSSNKVSEKVDVFSFGIVMWEILTGEEPYANMHYGAIIGGIVSNTLRPPIPSFCDPEWRRLMEQCWAPDPTARPSFTEIVSRFRVIYKPR
ncbi:hypothetical protein ACLOJK_021850 [Asimina triloba]